jgi:hypothetical protein
LAGCSGALIWCVTKVDRMKNTGRILGSAPEGSQGMVREGISAAADRHPSFRLRRASFNGRGLQDTFRDAAWSQIRDAAYRGRGA